MVKPNEVKGQTKTDAKAADRHAPVRPDADAALWARTLTTKRVSELFKTLPGLDGHWKQVQAEVNAGNKYFTENSKTTEEGKKLIKFIGDAVVKAAESAKFDFPAQQLKFTNDTGWLKIERAAGKVNVKSRP